MENKEISLNHTETVLTITGPRSKTKFYLKRTAGGVLREKFNGRYEKTEILVFTNGQNVQNGFKVETRNLPQNNPLNTECKEAKQVKTQNRQRKPRNRYTRS